MATKLKRSNNVVWEELGGDVVLVNAATGARWLLNAAAATIWKLSDGTRTAGELAASLGLSRAQIAEFCASGERVGVLQATGSGSIAQPFAADSFRGMEGAPSFRVLDLGAGGRRRPNPRGISGPA